MYLSYRKNGVRFQIAVPYDLQDRIGRSPIRIALGRVSAADARRKARLLSGHAEQLFTAVRSSRRENMAADIRDAIIAELTDMVAAMIANAHEVEVLHEKHLAMEVENTERRMLIEESRRQKVLGSKLKTLGDTIADVQPRINQVIQQRRDDGGPSENPASLELIMKSFTAMSQQVADLSQRVQTSIEGPPRPPASEALQTWTDVRRKTKVDPKKITTDYNRITDFITFAGDKPLDKYTFLEFQRWSNLLARVPKNMSVVPHLKGKTHQQAADHNDRLKIPRPTMTTKTIETNYFSPLKSFFKQMAAEHRFQSPFGDADVRMDGRSSVKRRPFKVEQLNIWFAHAAQEARADMMWLPLLGAITGARIAELIFLQGRDIYQMENAFTGAKFWIIDLRFELIAEDGGFEERKIKTEASKRIIALHEIFTETGFIDYAKSRRDADWLFPASFYHGKERVADPPRAASKRMNRMLKDVGIHKPMERVFHSTRHTAKDIMRLARVDDRTNDLQTGHAFKTVSRGYGAKDLEELPTEIEVLTALPLPDGLDLGPYLDQIGGRKSRQG